MDVFLSDDGKRNVYMPKIHSHGLCQDCPFTYQWRAVVDLAIPIILETSALL